MSTVQNAPAITDVKDPLGNTVPPEGTTEALELTLYGSGAANSVVLIRDNDSLVGTASVTIESTWEKNLTVAPGDHSFTAHTTSGVASPPWRVTVGASLKLTAPTVVNAPEGSLNPVDALQGAKVVVSYKGMLTTDLIGVSWDGRDNLVLPQNGSTTESVTFNIPAFSVGAAQGKRIPVMYAVVRNGAATPSDPLELEVLALPPSALQGPKIRQAPDDQNLNLEGLPGDVDLYVPAWPFIAVGQRVWLRFEGTRTDGAAYHWTHDTWQNFPIPSTGELATTVKRSDLQLLRDTSDLRLILEVSFDEGNTRVAFPVKVLRVVKLPLVDTSSMVLDGITYLGLPNWVRNNYDTPGNTGVRGGSAGTPPYSYTSSAPAIASVDALGKVTGNRNGVAEITVRDSSQRSTSYRVNVSNVLQLIVNEGPMGIEEWYRWGSGVPGRKILSGPNLHQLLLRYSQPLPLNKNYWLFNGIPLGQYEYFNHVTHNYVITTHPNDPAVTGGWVLENA